jgi:hypothetical protein
MTNMDKARMGKSTRDISPDLGIREVFPEEGASQLEGDRWTEAVEIKWSMLRGVG